MKRFLSLLRYDFMVPCHHIYNWFYNFNRKKEEKKQGNLFINSDEMRIVCVCLCTWNGWLGNEKCMVSDDKSTHVFDIKLQNIVRSLYSVKCYSLSRAFVHSKRPLDVVYIHWLCLDCNAIQTNTTLLIFKINICTITITDWHRKNEWSMVFEFMIERKKILTK